MVSKGSFIEKMTISNASRKSAWIKACYVDLMTIY